MSLGFVLSLKVFKVNAPLLPTRDFKSDIIPYSDSNNLCYVTTSTQTPPEFAPSEDEHLQSGMPELCSLGQEIENVLQRKTQISSLGKSRGVFNTQETRVYIGQIQLPPSPLSSSLVLIGKRFPL